ncbi:replication protein RepA [Rothia sp. (in: high G+C Gram-positive bacteria)]|uniref:replication protein RepA n=1 Tax=Rothia sp. (in: high G+C Gram-positive bacteria) TaxID=1885016 RepID=UPI0032167E98
MVGRGREIVFDANADIKERESHLLLSDDFFESVMQSDAVPVETETWRELLSESKSPLALDIYLWLSSRLPKLQTPCISAGSSVRLSLALRHRRFMTSNAASVWLFKKPKPTCLTLTSPKKAKANKTASKALSCAPQSAPSRKNTPHP